MGEEECAGRGKKTGPRKRRLNVMLLLLLLLIVLFIFFKRYLIEEHDASREQYFVDSIHTGDTIAAVLNDTDSVQAGIQYIDTAMTTMPESLVSVSDTVGSAAGTGSPGTLEAVDMSHVLTSAEEVAADSIDSGAGTASPVNPCEEDMPELWVYPDPSGGLHYREVRVRFVANRDATIHYRFENDSAWTLYNGADVVIGATTTLYYDAIDSCGMTMERRSEYYEVDVSHKKSPCSSDMVQVKVGVMNFCIDRYEWPNRIGESPQSYISKYQAEDSCYSIGKRLCTSEEWAVACSGPYTWKYPYGNSYERYGCITHDTAVAQSGSRPECRTFFGAFDMSGNLLEWTSTRASENGSFFYVMGGFWESGPKSACGDRRYSYYPQNSHNPVGFRCCSDLPKPQTPQTGGGR